MAAKKVNTPNASPISSVAVDAMTVPLCTAHEQCEQGPFSCCDSDCEHCDVQCSPRKSAMESATISLANVNTVTKPASVSSRDVRTTFIELAFLASPVAGVKQT